MPSLTSHEPNTIAIRKNQELNVWASSLKRWGLAGFVSALLENHGAFATLFAQSLYVSQPLLEPWLKVHSLAHMLEDPLQTQAFAKLLQEEPR